MTIHKNPAPAPKPVPTRESNPALAVLRAIEGLSLEEQAAACRTAVTIGGSTAFFSAPANRAMPFYFVSAGHALRRVYLLLPDSSVLAIYEGAREEWRRVAIETEPHRILEQLPLAALSQSDVSPATPAQRELLRRYAGPSVVPPERVIAMVAASYFLDRLTLEPNLPEFARDMIAWSKETQEQRLIAIAP